MSGTPASDTTTLDGANRVDVHQAEADFTQLRRDLSSPDYNDPAARTHSPTLQSEHNPKELEEAPVGDEAEERFDLREYLSSSNNATQAAGIKHKHVGVTWNDLEVIGLGGEDNKVKFPSPAESFLTPDILVRSTSPPSWPRLWGRSCSL